MATEPPTLKLSAKSAVALVARADSSTVRMSMAETLAVVMFGPSSLKVMADPRLMLALLETESPSPSVMVSVRVSLI